jgi:hypothetical protein
MNPVQTTASSERVFKRNYELGKPQSVFVGEPVVTFKDYVAVTRRGKTMRPSVSFRVVKQAGMKSPLSMAADQDYLVTGFVPIDGVDYSAVVFPGTGNLAVLVGPDGRPYHRLFVWVVLQMAAGSATFDPPTGITFRPGADEVMVDKRAGFRNFELVYGGTDGKSFILSYREYSPDDLIRPAFTQTLTYERGATSVRFRDVQIAVQEVTSEKITYTVLADGGGSGPSPK